MITASMKACFVACILASCALTPAEVRAQAATELLPTERPIPDGYDSWSLFLVCNPAWIIENGDRGIADLFNQYRAFGRSIGPKNLAIKLLPSESPQVLVTTRNPDDPNPGDYVVVSLNGLAAKDGALVLLKLADQLVVTGLNQSGIDASDQVAANGCCSAFRDQRGGMLFRQSVLFLHDWRNHHENRT